MKHRSTIILGAVLVLLGIVYFTTTFNPPEVTKGAALLFEGQKPDIDRIEISSATGITVLLTKQNGLWYMEQPFEFKADDRYVNNFVTQVQDVYIDGIISDRPEAQREFVVDDSTGIALKISSAGVVLLESRIGKPAMEIGHFYARRAGSNDIELWRGMISQEVRRNPSEWRDRTIYRFNQDDIMRVTVAEHNQTRELRFENTTWVYSENGTERPVDPTRVRTSVGFLSNLNAEDFASEGDIQVAVSRPYDAQVSFTVRNGDTHVYHLWKPEGASKSWLMRKENGDILYVFFSYGRRLSFEYADLQQAAS